jgi:hypothetical protein
MTVLSFVSYCGDPFHSAEMGDAAYFIRSVKTRGKAEPYLTRLSRRCTLDTRTHQEVLDWFGRLATWIIEVDFSLPHIVLVPLPNSDCSLENRNVPRTRRLADAIASKLATATVFDGLRWIREKRPSHRGGGRDPRTLFRNLALVHVPSCAEVGLVDDVITTGAHLQAAAAKLSSVGVKCDRAICLARTEPSCLHPFAIKQTFISEMLVSYSKRSECEERCTSSQKTYALGALQRYPHIGCTI